MKKKWLVLALVLLLCVAAAVYFLWPENQGKPLADTKPFDAVLTAEEATYDLAYMYSAVKQYHPCYLDGSGLDKAFDEAYARAKEKLAAEEEVTVGELWAIGAEMYCVLEDAHTLVTYRGGREVTDKTPLQGEVIAVNGIPRAELLERFGRYYPCEPQVAFYLDGMLNQALATERWLRLLGVDVTDGLAVETPEGIVQLTLGDPVQSAAEEEPFYHWYIDEEHAAGVFVLKECNPTDGYKQALKEFFTAVSEKGVERIAVDLRSNGGGNSQVVNEFMRYIDVETYSVFGGSIVREKGLLITNEATVERNRRLQPVFSGEVYVLTAHTTFSSAMGFAMAVADNGIGQIIGEPPGNMPSHYGDKRTGQAPNSGLVCSMSYKKFYRVDRSKDGQPVLPHIETAAEDALETFLNLK